MSAGNCDPAWCARGGALSDPPEIMSGKNRPAWANEHVVPGTWCKKGFEKGFQGKPAAQQPRRTAGQIGVRCYTTTARTPRHGGQSPAWDRKVGRRPARNEDIQSFRPGRPHRLLELAPEVDLEEKKIKRRGHAAAVGFSGGRPTYTDGTWQPLRIRRLSAQSQTPASAFRGGDDTDVAGPRRRIIPMESARQF